MGNKEKKKMSGDLSGNLETLTICLTLKSILWG